MGGPAWCSREAPKRCRGLCERRASQTGPTVQRGRVREGTEEVPSQVRRGAQPKGPHATQRRYS
eukprot:4195023-Pyramimonas_sp.AAC.1